MRLFANTLRAGIENAEEREAENQLVEAALDGTHDDMGESQELNEAIIELDDGAEELEMRNEVLERSVDVHQALESLADDYRVRLEQGGMTRAEAGFAQKHHHYLLNQVGMTASQKAGIESFGEGSDEHATRAGLEGLVEDAKKLWDKIIQWIKNGIKRVKEFLQELFGKAERLKKKAEKLAGALKEMDDSAFTGVIVPLTQSEARTVTLEHEVVVGRKAVAPLMDFASDAIDGYRSLVTKGLSDIVDLYEKPYDPDRKLPDMRPSSSLKKEWLSENGAVAKYKSRYIPGNLHYVITLPLERGRVGDAEARAAFEEIALTYFDATGTGEQKLKGLSRSDCIGGVEGMIGVLNAVIDNRKEVEKGTELKERLVKGCERMKKEFKDVKDAEERKVNTWLRGMAGNIPQVVDGYVIHANKAVIASVAAQLSYIQRNIKLAKANKAKE